MKIVDTPDNASRLAHIILFDQQIQERYNTHTHPTLELNSAGGFHKPSTVFKPKHSTSRNNRSIWWIPLTDTTTKHTYVVAL
jgi:hypothetical protein